MADYPIEEPTRTPDDSPSRPGAVRETHPAYGQITANRVSGRAHLYGSDFDHQHYVTIHINRSEVTRDLSHDWVHPREELIEVALSEAQWATFVSSMNVGSGARCTLQRVNYQPIPQLPAPPRRHDQFQQEIAAVTARARAALVAAKDAIEAKGLSGKATKELCEGIVTAMRALDDSVPYVGRAFDEHMETVVEAAKIEIAATMERVLVQAGMRGIAAGTVQPFGYLEETDDAPTTPK